ncbi:MAG TPA: hypothetical protein GYA07_09505 [Verrucomicrobia bacterium]|nr:hypothetical protein [Verrucomicrobiota bacterium]HOP96957.1 hemerythrin domain-containing protein [Verrucomicrobiota bacterium]HPU57042.1 hemerythrin domain-containing protein [Verrucomicrobiota bacterium]
MKITEALMAEHLVFHNLFDYVEKTAPGLKSVSEIRSLASLLEFMLAAHSKTEDDLFIGPLDPAFEQLGQRETFHHEHELIDHTLALAKRAARADKARAHLLSAITLCRSHFDKEERIVFPMAERLLKSKTLQELGKTWLEQRERVIK